MAGQYGVKETKDVLAFGLDIGCAFLASKADDGKINGLDIPKFLPALLDLPPAIENVGLVAKEMGELDEADLSDMRAFVLEKAKNIPGIEHKWLDVANGAMTIGLGVVQVMAALKTPAANA